MSTFRVAVLLLPLAIEAVHVHHEPVRFVEPAGVVLALPEQPAQPHTHEDPSEPREPDLPVAVVSGVLMALSRIRGP